MNKKITKILGIATIAALALSGCSGTTSSSESSSGETTLVVGVSPVPHGDILGYVAKELAPKAGLKIDIKEYTDYIQPNAALDSGDLDANYYQHIPYLEQSSKDNGYEFTPGKGVHIEPIGLYSKSVKSVDEIKEGAKIGITNDPSNQGRALKLLEAHGLIELDSAVEDYSVLKGIKSNPKKIEFVEADPAALPRSLESVDAAIINGNYALEADLSPSKDAIALEDGKNNPYGNLLVRRTDLSGDKLKAW